jgi:hypothetical protein
MLQRSALGLTGLVVSGMVPAGRLAAQDDLPHVDESDPTAQSLKYMHDATQSERTDSSQLCNNCLYFKGSAGDEWARCDLFPGKQVNGNGWCSAWTQKS